MVGRSSPPRRIRLWREASLTGVNLRPRTPVWWRRLSPRWRSPRPAGCDSLVYNTGGYGSLPALRLLDGIVDIYLPDMKYGDSTVARHYSRVRHYAETNRAAVKKMYRQVGDLALDGDGLARRGLLVRHLVLPGAWPARNKCSPFSPRTSPAPRISTSWTRTGPATARTTTRRSIDPSPMTNCVMHAGWRNATGCGGSTRACRRVARG